MIFIFVFDNDDDIIRHDNTHVLFSWASFRLPTAFLPYDRFITQYQSTQPGVYKSSISTSLNRCTMLHAYSNQPDAYDSPLSKVFGMFIHAALTEYKDQIEMCAVVLEILKRFIHELSGCMLIQLILIL